MADLSKISQRERSGVCEALGFDLSKIRFRRKLAEIGLTRISGQTYQPSCVQAGDAVHLPRGLRHQPNAEHQIPADSHELAEVDGLSSF